MFLFFSPIVNAYVSVKGYYRSDGTYVRPYVRSNPNGLKYDNYSYTPSQGLYNPTYGTRGSYWDTPTYYTDPYYYLGLNLYKSGITSDPTTYTSSNYYTQNCPINSYYDSSTSSCSCYGGYVKSGNSCISGNSLCWDQNGYNSSYDSTTNSCKCDYGYTIGTSGKCEYKKPITYYENSGYYTNRLNCPLNSHESPYDSTKCECDIGYQVNQTKTACILTTNYTNSYIQQTQTTQNDKTAGINYYKSNKTCIGLENNQNQYAECISYAYNH